MHQFWVNASILSMLLVVVGSLPLARTPRQASAPVSLVTQQLADLARGAPLVIDGDNVRGKAAFAWSQTELLKKLHGVINIQGLASGVRTQLHFDHGARCDTFPVGSSEKELVCVVFSGPQASADDTICRDVQWWAQYLGSEQSVEGSALKTSEISLSQVITVVTDDSELRNRCRRNLKGNAVLVRFISSYTFVGFLKAQVSEDTALELEGLRRIERGEEANDNNSVDGILIASSESPTSTAISAESVVTNSAVETAIEAVQQEQYWRRELRKARQQLKHGCSRKQRSKLEKTLMKLEAKAASSRTIGQKALDLPETPNNSDAKGPEVSLLDGVMAAASAPSDRKEQEPGNLDEKSVAMAVMEGLQRAGRARAKKRTNSEHTWERVVAAEKFRSHLAAIARSPSITSKWLQSYAEFHRS